MTERTKRGSLTRWYVDGDHLIGRMKDTPAEHIPLASLPDHLRIEGHVAQRSKGIDHETILTTQPNRTIPKGKGPVRVTEQMRRREAIAYAAAEQDTRPGFVGVKAVDKDAALAAGREWAASLSDADVKDLSNRATVLSAYSRLYASKEPLVRKPVLQEAAD